MSRRTRARAGITRRSSGCWRGVEALERRNLLAVLSFESPLGDGADLIEIRRAGNKVELLNDGELIDEAPLAGLTAIEIFGAEGESDELIVNFGFGGLFAVPDGIQFTGGRGSEVIDTLTVLGTNAANEFTMTNSDVTVDESVIPYADVEEFDLDAALPGTSPGDNFTGDFVGGFANRLTLQHFEARHPQSPTGGTVIQIIDGDLTGNLIAGGSGRFDVLDVGGSVTSTGSVVAAAITTMTVAEDLDGAVSVDGTATATTTDGNIAMLIVGDSLGGTVSALGSGTIGVIDVGSVAGTGTVTAEAITTMTVAFNLDGAVSVDGTATATTTDGSIATLIVGGSLGGSVSALGSGTIGVIDVGSIAGTGTVTAEAITTMTVAFNLDGTVSVDGTATATTTDGSIATLIVGGSLGGSVSALGSGTIGVIDVGSVAGTGTVTAEAITTMTVALNLDGAVSVDGTATATTTDGSIATLIVGGSLGGSVSALGSGTIGVIDVGSVAGTGTVTAEAITTMTVALNLNGVVSVDGTATATSTDGSIATLIVGGSLGGSVSALGSGTIGVIEVGSVAMGGGVTAEAITTMTVAFNLDGIVSVDGTATATTTDGSIATLIVGGSLGGSVSALGSGTIGVISVGSVAIGGGVTAEAITTMSVAGNMNGSVSVDGTATATSSDGNIGTLTVVGSLGGSVSALGSGTIGVISVGSVASAGTVTAEAITTMTVAGNLDGSVSVDGTATATSSDGSIASLIVVGSLGGSVSALGSGTIGVISVGSVASAGTVTAEAITTMTVAGNLNGSVRVDGTATATSSDGSINTLIVGGALGGNVSALGSGTIGVFEVGSVASTGTVTAEAITTMTVASNLDGSVSVDGTTTATSEDGSIASLIVGGSLGGSVSALGSGTIGIFEVGSVASAGTVTAEAITTMTVAGNLDGSVRVDGTATATSSDGSIASLIVVGSLGGSVSALGSGTIGVFEVGSVASAGTVTAEAITTMTVAGNLDGSVRVDGTATAASSDGSIASLIVVGSLGGSVSALGSGTIGVFEVGSVASAGTVTAEAITTMTVAGNLDGSVRVDGTATATSSDGSIATLIVGGSLGGTVSALGSGTIGVIQVGSVATAGTVRAEEITTMTVAGNLNGAVIVDGTATATHDDGDIGSLTIGGNLAGDVSAIGSGTIGPIQVGGSLTATGSITAEVITTMSIHAAAHGTIAAADIGAIAGVGVISGSPVFNIIEAGVLRQLIANRADTGDPTPATVLFTFAYDSTGSGDPQLALRVTNGDPDESADDVRFDLSLVTSTADEFDLAYLDAEGTSGLRSLAIEGDLLTTVTAFHAATLGIPANTQGGVHLPLDRLAGFAVQDQVVQRTVRVSAIQVVSFGRLTLSNKTVSGQLATQADATKVVSVGAAFDRAGETVLVPLAEGQPVGMFVVTIPGKLDAKKIVWTDQITNDESITAAVAAVNGGITTIDIAGDGAAIKTNRTIAGAIDSEGSLGDLLLTGSTGIGDVTAESFFGSIQATGTVHGTIQSRSGDIGIPLFDSGGTLVGATTIKVGGKITGRIIARGDLISAIEAKKGVSGVIAAEGDIGAAQLQPDGSLIRVGGILASAGGISGQVVALGNILGDVRAIGSLTGRIAALGSPIAGLDPSRTGILGKVEINGSISAAGKIVSSGRIGDALGGTQLTSGTINGMLAAKGDINFGLTGSTSTAKIFENAAGANAAAIDAIFTDGGLSHEFDLTGFDLAGLNLILADLAALHVNASGNLAGPVA